MQIQVYSPVESEKPPEGIPRLEFQPWSWWLFLLLLSFSTGNTKVAGAAWFLMIVLAIFFRFSNKNYPCDGHANSMFLKAAKLWLWFCIAGFSFKFVGVVYWGDPWGTRHFDIRLIFAAMAIFFLLSKIELDASRKLQLIGALFLASCTALVVSYLHVNHGIQTPSNRINWSGGLVMLSWCLMPVVASTKFAVNQRWIALISVLILWVSVLMTGARGAYLSLPWFFVFAVALIVYQANNRRMMLKRLSISLAGTLSCFLILYHFAPKAIEIPHQRIALAKEEARQALVVGADGHRMIDTSVGTRIFMWDKSIEVFKESPWLGYGREQRMAFIKEWGQEAKAHMVSGQTHLHSEYINGMVDHGVLGLASTLSYIFGLIAVFLYFLRNAPFMALSMLGIAFTHITMSITDTNSQTNNYSVMLGLAIMLVFLLRVRQ